MNKNSRNQGKANPLLIALILALVGAALGLPFLAGTEEVGAQEKDLDPPLLLQEQPELDPIPAVFHKNDKVGLSSDVSKIDLEAKPRTGLEPKSGYIEGLVHLAEGIDPPLQSVTVILEEAANRADLRKKKKLPRRLIRSFDVEPGSRTVPFSIEGVPFSIYGWRVRSYAPHMNGSEQIVALGPDHPDSRVLLKLHPPVPVSVLVKDQNRLAVPDVPVILVPLREGQPGRTLLRGKTDLLGLCLFGQVLAGKYRLVLGSVDQPLLPAREVEVGTGGQPVFQAKLPRGGSVRFLVTHPGGGALEGVEILAIARDSKIYRKRTATTDRLGHGGFSHLAPGRYLVHFKKKGFERGFESIHIEKDSKLEKTVILPWQR
ncbi:MAG TPA: carboxypeptidase regulatory-like domain-containing protein [Planctomycetes bacterium]|nr:carboxypeptidase regulatory-like domain-containing protein [Planctomycetota bacterium]